jgi:penicillin-binding protein 2
MKFRFALIVSVVLLAACGPGAGPPGFEPQPGAPTATAPPGVASAAQVAAQFVDALNRKDFVTAHALLTAEARVAVASPDVLRQAYDDARVPGGVLTMTAGLRGGLLTTDPASAEAQVVTTWDGPLLGAFDVTSTLPLAVDPATGIWQVRWSRNAIAAGLEGGQLLLERRWLPRASVNAGDGTLLVGPSPRTTLGLQLNAIADAAEEAKIVSALSRISGMTPDAIKAKYADLPRNWYVPIVELPVETVEDNSGLLQPYPAIIAQETFVRTLYKPEFAPHIVGLTGAITPETIDAYQARGYSGDERVGLTGVEGGAESILAGRPELMLRVIGGGKIRTLVERRAQRGNDVTLTLNSSLQMQAQQLIDRRKGAVVVLRATDGAVLAMANYPTYDPTNILNEDVQSGALLNRAVQGLYPPGSVFKMVTMAAGIGEGVTDMETIYSDPGYWTGYGPSFRKNCWRSSGHGRISLKDGLTASCNIVFYEVGRLLEERGSTVLGDYARRFGFGAPTGIDLAGEFSGVVPDPEYKLKTFGEAWRPGDTVNLAVGQGFMLVTPLQVARMTAAIANGGTLVQPFVVADPLQPKPPAPALPLAPDDLAVMQSAMVGVTTNGRIGTTTYRFAGFDYYQVGGQWIAGKSLTAAQRNGARRLTVAGKSGTAQAPGNVLPFAWFTAYAPADAPEIVVTVLLENAGQGSGQAGPVARQMIESHFGLPISPTPKDALEND